jgi:alcohol dehydrogenase
MIMAYFETATAVTHRGPGQKSWEDVPDATIQEPTDVVVRVDTTTICGTDLHILHGDVAAVTDGRILGHEAVGTVTEVGEAVKGFSVGDRVLVPAITKCGRCEYCQRNMPSHCQTVGGIGWIFGHLIDGTRPRTRPSRSSSLRPDRASAATPMAWRGNAPRHHLPP